MVVLNDESGPALTRRTANSADLIHSRLGGTTIDEYANTPRRHSRRPGPAVTDYAALREALDCAHQAAIAVDLGDKAHARDWLAKGAVPAARAFPERPDVSFGLALVFGVILEDAA
jgi:hypothetical protein